MNEACPKTSYWQNIPFITSSGSAAARQMQIIYASRGIMTMKMALHGIADPKPVRMQLARPIIYPTKATESIEEKDQHRYDEHGF